MNSNRIVWIDYAKVICIFLMVCCHAGLQGFSLTIIYQFHMPAFFIISGMLFHPKKPIVVIKGLGIPILIYGIINLLNRFFMQAHNVGWNSFAMFEQGGILIKAWFKNFLFASDVSVFQGYWFVMTLLLMRLLMGVCFLERHKVIIAIICIAWCCVEPFIDFVQPFMVFKPYHIISCFPFYILGIWIRENNIEVMNGSYLFKSIILVIFLILTWLQGRIDLSEYNYGVSYLLCFANACFGSYILFGLCNLLLRNVFIETLSAGTLLILGVHGILYGYFNYLLRKIGLAGMYTSLLTGAFVLFICYLPIWWCSNKLPIMLGKVKY